MSTKRLNTTLIAAILTALLALAVGCVVPVNSQKSPETMSQHQATSQSVSVENAADD